MKRFIFLISFFVLFGDCFLGAGGSWSCLNGGKKSLDESSVSMKCNDGAGDLTMRDLYAIIGSLKTSVSSSMRNQPGSVHYEDLDYSFNKVEFVKVVNLGKKRSWKKEKNSLRKFYNKSGADVWILSIYQLLSVFEEKAEENLIDYYNYISACYEQCHLFLVGDTKEFISHHSVKGLSRKNRMSLRSVKGFLREKDISNISKIFGRGVVKKIEDINNCLFKKLSVGTKSDKALREELLDCGHTLSNVTHEKLIALYQKHVDARYHDMIIDVYTCNLGNGFVS